MNKVNLKYKLEMLLPCDFLSQYCFFPVGYTGS